MVSRPRFRRSPVPSFTSILVLALAGLMLLSGCPRQAKRRTLVPGVPTSGDATARARFQEAKSRFEREGEESAAEFEAIAQAYPDDPIAPYALLYAGIAAVNGRAYDQAVTNLEALGSDPEAAAGLRVRGQLFLGIAFNYLGRHDQAVAPLRAGEPAIESEAERGEWVAAMAESLGRGKAPLESLGYYDRWHKDASQSERAYIVARLGAVVAAADPAGARAAYEGLARKDSPSAAILGERVAADFTAAGSPDSARRVRKQIEAGRQALGLMDTRSGEGGDPGKVGAILPMTGRSAQAGDLAMRGLALASGTFADARGQGMRAFHVSVHDTATTAAGAGRAVEKSVDEGVIALIGPIDGQSVDVASAAAHARGVPLISLNPRSEGRASQGSRFVFHILQSAEDRAGALARHAYQNGVRGFAILRPDNGYGRAVSEAFRREVARLGGQVVADVTYKPGDTTFGDSIKKLGDKWQAVFVPEQATRLELIAPALAAADLVVAPLSALGQKKRGRTPGRTIGLLATAEFAAVRYVRSAGRYSVGAVLAPGFFPDRDDPLIRDFVDRYEQVFGAAPTALDAHAHDAALVVRAAVEQGASSRAELADIMAASRVKGLTGTIAFGERRGRSDDGLLFTVVRAGEDFAIRAMRD
jgi:branched-chain amino acid transport system substrate-binding protein